MIYFIDLFAGAGGVTTGLSNVPGIKVVACINHDPMAIKSHAENHPDCLHFTEDIRTIDLHPLMDIVKAIRKKDKNAIIAIWASIECFIEGTLILTKRGMVDIKDIVVGDEVLTHKNRYKRVYSTMSKLANTVEIKGHGFTNIETTHEHPFYIRKRNKVWHNDVRAYRSEFEDPSWCETEKLVPNESFLSSPIKFEKLEIPEIPGRGFTFSNELWWLIGRYLGDGSLSLRKSLNGHPDSKQIVISCGKHKTELLEQKLSLFQPINKRSGKSELKFHKRETRTAFNYATSHDGLFDFILEHFGKLADGKKIPSWALSMPDEWKTSLLDGYKSSDGYVNKNDRTDITTVSKKLAIGIKLLAQSLGYVVNIQKYFYKDTHVIEGRTVNVKEQYKIYWLENPKKNYTYSDDDHIYGQLKKINETNKIKLVYNISVEDDESYVAEGIVVHNCVNFSRAKGGLPRDADSRTLANDLFRYLKAFKPDMLFIENVTEFMAWGPLDEKGKPVSMKNGEDYQKWVANVCRHGYKFDYRIFNSANFGAYTSRQRYFAQFVKPKYQIKWPHPTHAKRVHKTDLFHNGLKPWKAVKEVLDLDVHGESIFSRTRKKCGSVKNLSDKTYMRIYMGLIKFVAGGKDQFMLKYNSINKETGKYLSPDMDEPSPTVSTQGRLGIVSTQFLSKYYSGRPYDKNHSIDEPAGAIKTVDSHSFITTYHGKGKNVHSIENPSPTIPTKDSCTLVNTQFIHRDFSTPTNQDINEPSGALMATPKVNLVSTQYIMNPQYLNSGVSIDGPAHTLIARMDKMPPYLVHTECGNVAIQIEDGDTEHMIKIKEFMALYGIVDIKMRMLFIDELKRIQGFPDNYVFHGTQADQKKQIGNAVEVNQATAIGSAIINCNI